MIKPCDREEIGTTPAVRHGAAQRRQADHRAPMWQ